MLFGDADPYRRDRGFPLAAEQHLGAPLILKTQSLNGKLHRRC